MARQSILLSFQPFQPTSTMTNPTNTPRVEADTVVTIRYRIDDAKGRPMQTKAEEVAYLRS